MSLLIVVALLARPSTSSRPPTFETMRRPPSILHSKYYPAARVRDEQRTQWMANLAKLTRYRAMLGASLAEAMERQAADKPAFARIVRVLDAEGPTAENVRGGRLCGYKRRRQA